jgi:hypothetical protein
MDAMPVEVFLDSFPAPIRRGASALRAIVRRVAPDAVERVRTGWGVIGYNVHLLFEHGVLMDDPLGILEGAGTTKQVRWLTFSGPGASGGPVFYGGFVYGLFSNASNCDDSGEAPCTPARYYRVSTLKLSMESADSDVHFICYEAVFCNPS